MLVMLMILANIVVAAVEDFILCFYRCRLCGVVDAVAVIVCYTVLVVYLFSTDTIGSRTRACVLGGLYAESVHDFPFFVFVIVDSDTFYAPASINNNKQRQQQQQRWQQQPPLATAAAVAATALHVWYMYGLNHAPYGSLHSLCNSNSSNNSNNNCGNCSNSQQQQQQHGASLLFIKLWP